MLRQGLHQKLSQKLSPQQIQLMKMVQLPTVAFEQRIEEELMENPALEDAKDSEVSEDSYEEDNYLDDVNDGEQDKSDDFEINIEQYISDDEVPQYKTDSYSSYSDSDETAIPYAQETSLSEYLLTQLSGLRMSEADGKIARFLIGSLDESGYIRRDEQSIANDIAFAENIATEDAEVSRIITSIIQGLEPIGVGARSLKECLVIQLKSKNQRKSIDLTIDILERSFDDFANRHFNKVLQRHQIEESELKLVLEEVEKLNPKPGKNFNTNPQNKAPQEQIIADFVLTIINGELDLKLNSRNVPDLRVSNAYTDILKTYKESEKSTRQQKDTVLFIKQKLDSAKWFIDAVRQRQNTLMLTMGAIVEYQKEFFLTGDYGKMKPLILKDIAEKIEMDISTISRVASSKYINTPYGTFLIKEFFSEGITNDEGEDVSTKEVKKKLELFIGNENKTKPLTDEKLTKLLKENGYPIARRTIAKYREQLNIPVARLRKELK